MVKSGLKPYRTQYELGVSIISSISIIGKISINRISISICINIIPISNISITGLLAS